MAHHMCAWMQAGEYDSVSQLRGSVGHTGAEDPHGFERADHMRVLDPWGTDR